MGQRRLPLSETRFYDAIHVCVTPTIRRYNWLLGLPSCARARAFFSREQKPCCRGFICIV